MTGRVPDSEVFGSQNADKERSEKRITDALRLDGSQFVRLYEKMQALIAGLNQTVTSVVQSITYTRSEIDTRVANPPTNVAITGTVSATGLASFPAGVASQNVRSFVVSTNYAGVWVDGSSYRLGISPSTRRFKTRIRPWIEDVEKFLDVEPVRYHLRIPERTIVVLGDDGQPLRDENGELVTYTEPAYEDAPDAPWRVGFIAEDLVAAGFEEQVVFDEDGNPISINYAEIVIPQQMAMRWLRDQVRAVAAEQATLRTQIAALAEHVGFPLPQED